MNAVPASNHTTVEDYLSIEDASTEKHELIGGQLYAMAGASFAHNQIAANVLGEIYQFLRDKSCRIYGSDLKIHIKSASGFAYPDLSIVCNGAQFLNGRNDVVVNPSVIIEILSPETTDYDYGKKFMLYRQIPTLQEYILISSSEIKVEKFSRNDDASWTLMGYQDVNKSFFIDTIHYKTTLGSFYRDVVLDENNSNAAPDI